jgi:hypothetical protein
LLVSVAGAVLLGGLRGCGRRRLNHELGDVQSREGEIYRCVDLARSLLSGRGEALEVDDEEPGRSGQNDALRGLSFTSTVRTFPNVVIAEHFLLAVTA